MRSGQAFTDSEMFLLIMGLLVYSTVDNPPPRDHGASSTFSVDNRGNRTFPSQV